jgi:pyruvate/2-oxoglutarate dehydrogenase complex dihydrolipoamide acyltransferase (E2) component
VLAIGKHFGARVPAATSLTRANTRPGIRIAPPTLMITVGGIATKPRYIDAQPQPREMLDLTISVDHEVVDGAPAAPFPRRLAELVEQADGLSGG